MFLLRVLIQYITVFFLFIYSFSIFLYFKQVENFLSRVEQSPAKSMQAALSPLTNALVTDELLRHENVDVKVAVASCVSEITRITAPDAPYDDDKMKVLEFILRSHYFPPCPFMTY